MVALSKDEHLLGKLFQYRFPAGRGLAGHSFGNLFLTALTNVTGDFPEAVRVSSQVLAIRGRIFPSTRRTSLSKPSSRTVPSSPAKRKFPARRSASAASVSCRAACARSPKSSLRFAPPT